MRDREEHNNTNLITLIAKHKEKKGEKVRKKKYTVGLKNKKRTKK